MGCAMESKTILFQVFQTTERSSRVTVWRVGTGGSRIPWIKEVMSMTAVPKRALPQKGCIRRQVKKRCVAFYKVSGQKGQTCTLRSPWWNRKSRVHVFPC